MSNELKKAFEAYFELVVKRLRTTEAIDLRGKVIELEKDRCFENLKCVAQNEFPQYNDFNPRFINRHHLRNPKFAKNHYFDELADHYLPNFFRRSQCYLDICRGEELDKVNLYLSFCSAFTNKKTTVLNLFAFENVGFDGFNMDFKDFSIRRYDSALEERLEVDNSRIFYPELVLPNMKDCWLVLIEDIDNLPSEEDPDIEKYELLPDYSAKVKSILRLISLYDWNSPNESSYERTTREANAKVKIDQFFRIYEKVELKRVLILSDDLLAPPYDYISSWKGARRPYNDINTDDDTKIKDMEFYEIRSNDFADELKEIQKILFHIEENFADHELINNIKLAADYLLKAFSCNGLEQLLWHIIVLESLVGENNNRISKTIRRRISAILAGPNLGKNKMADLIYNLQTFRNNLVHGSPLEESILAGHLHQARHLARASIIWFLNYLNEAVKQGHIMPNRKDILDFIDEGKHAFE